MKMFVYHLSFAALLVAALAHSEVHAERTVEPETNPHKALFLWLFAKTGCDQAFEVVDAFMRPLPFLVQSLLSTTFISVVPIFLIFALNSLFDSKSRDKFTYVLLSFALGGLLGDVFFHTMPHLSAGHDHSHHGHVHVHDHSHHEHDHAHDHSHHDHGHAHSEEDMQTNLMVVMGIWIFFVLEKITHAYFSDDHNHSHSKNAVTEE